VAVPLWKQPVTLRNKWEFRTKRVAILMVIGVAS